MRLTPSLLQEHLKKSLAPFYLLYGQETFLIEESAKLIRQHLPEYEIHQASLSLETDLEELRFILDQPSLFAATLLLDCRLVKLSPGSSQIFTEILQTNYPHAYFLIQAGQLSRQQQQAPWFKLIEQKGIVIPHWGLNSAQFNRWINERATKLGLVLSPVLRQNLLAKTQGNCLAGAQELDILRLNATTNYISEQSQFEVSELCEAVLSKNSKSVVKIISYLAQNEAPQLVIWALHQTLNILLRGSSGTADIAKLLQKAGIRSQMQTLYHQVLQTPLCFCCTQLLSYLSQADNQVKSGDVTKAWQTVLNICLQMTGHNFLSALY
ncbi:MAG: DNA polymerase III subunit delta [Proteobacteria bacterium]|nr:DNA polymerase III subunit delta [Pseudomonadota bacterium]